MTYACSDCSNCGKCYPKHEPCPSCGEDIYLLDDKCPHCGAPITDEMRETARHKYMDYKRGLREKVYVLAQKAQAEERAARPKVVYPWDE